MPHHFLTDKFVFCCLTPEQQTQLKTDIGNPNAITVRACQQNLTAEKHGYRCSICGRLYPYLRIKHRDSLIDPNCISKLRPKAIACKKAAAIFCGDHYYAFHKKTLLKFQLDAHLQAQQTDVIPIMGGVYHSRLSRNETYLATETFAGTLGIYDLKTKQLLARKLHRELNGKYLFVEDDRLLYYFQDTIRCWDFRNNREEILWTVPEAWKYDPELPHPVIVVCSRILYNRKEEQHLFHLKARNTTYIVRLKDLAHQSTVTLPGAATLAELVYSEESDRYTLSTADTTFIYDSSFGIVETFSHPQLISIMNGSGFFPITRFENQPVLLRTFLSPDGKWILLDYFNSVILMERESRELKYCRFSYTGGASKQMGFLDSKHFWYTWNDTTYIQEIAD